MVDKLLDRVTPKIDQALDKVDLSSRNSKLAVTGLAALGALYVGKTALCALKCTVSSMLQPGNLCSRYQGGWAVVTYASDGLGKEYALKLAEQGFDVVLMVDNQARGDQVAR